MVEALLVMAGSRVSSLHVVSSYYSKHVLITIGTYPD
jgi:hypothetical protein